MSQISVEKLSFEYDGGFEKVFENVSFQIDTDWKLGFIGRNGRGKTTFLKLLMNEYEYNGEIKAPDVLFDYYPFDVLNKNDLSLNVIDTICNDAQLWEIQKECSLLEIDEDVLYRPYNELSGGEQTKIMLIGLFLKKDNFLLIDEPTTHLDTIGRKKVSGYLNGKKGFIVVSHDRMFLDNCIDHVLSINKTNIDVQRGSFSSWWENKNRIDSFETARNNKLKKDIKKLDEAAKRTSNWSEKVEKTKYGVKNSGLKQDKGYVGHKAAKMMKRSKAIEARKLSAADEKSMLLKNIDEKEKLALSPLKHHADVLIRAANISAHYNGVCALNEISFTVNQGERVLLTGKNGSGKTTLLNIVNGCNITYTGTLSIAPNAAISFVSQHTSGISGSLSTFAQKNNIDEPLFKAILRKLGFPREQFIGDISSFSSGQKKKVLIAKSLCEKAHIYIWDEPLNYIDVISRIQIEELLTEYKPTMLFVEHDEQFAKNIATKIIECG